MRLQKLILSIGPDPSPVRPNIIGGKGLASETTVQVISHISVSFLKTLFFPEGHLELSPSQIHIAIEVL